jgi:hypothetical protein
MLGLYELKSINKVRLSIASTQPFLQLTVSDNIANFIRKLSVLRVQTSPGLKGGRGMTLTTQHN